MNTFVSSETQAHADLISDKLVTDLNRFAHIVPDYHPELAQDAAALLREAVLFALSHEPEERQIMSAYAETTCPTNFDGWQDIPSSISSMEWHSWITDTTDMLREDHIPTDMYGFEEIFVDLDNEDDDF